MRKEFVTFYSPGTLFSESTTREIASRDTALAVKMAAGISERYNASPFGFRFDTRLVHDPVPDGEGGTLDVMGKTVGTSGMYFLGGKLILAHEVPDGLPILRDNMRCNRWPVVIENNKSWRVTQPFESGDCIVNDDGIVTRRGTDVDLVEYRAAKIAEWESEWVVTPTPPPNRASTS